MDNERLPPSSSFDHCLCDLATARSLSSMCCALFEIGVGYVSGDASTSE
jgi:hypothetical protein